MVEAEIEPGIFSIFLQRQCQGKAPRTNHSMREISGWLMTILYKLRGNLMEKIETCFLSLIYYLYLVSVRLLARV